MVHDDQKTDDCQSVGHKPLPLYVYLHLYEISSTLEKQLLRRWEAPDGMKPHSLPPL